MQENLKENAIPKFLDELNEFDVEEIENALISLYLKSECTDLMYIIKEKLDYFSIQLNIEVLTYIFEALLETNSIVENGIVFTPQYIASFIGKNQIDNFDNWTEDVRIIDPGCGCGIFLVTAIDYIRERFNVKTKNIIKNNIFGIDLEEDNVRRCKKILKMMVELEGDIIDESEINVINEDSLKINWNEIFTVSGFDLIIGNPPYVNTHDMNKETIKYLKENYKTTQTGVFNIFYAFIEHGMKFLKGEGKLSYIIPNNFLTIKSALDLRAYLQDNRYVKMILDFAENMVFKPVRTYNCIIVLDKTGNEVVEYTVLEKTDDLEKALNSINYNTISITRLDKNGWNLVDKKTYSNLYKIENQYKRIKDYVRTGIATLKDDVYMVNKAGDCFYKEINGIRYEIEEDIVKSIYKIPELKKSDKLENVCRYIIFPYEETQEGVKIILEDDMKCNFPKTYQYLCAVKDKLDTRDKGKVNPVAWYAYGRTQGLNKYGRKLLFPTFADVPKFMLVEDETALFCNGYGVFENDYLDLEELISVLNSRVMEYYVANTSYAIEGGYFCYQKKYIEKFSIPWFDEEERRLLRNGDKQDVDKMLIQKYGLVV